MYQPDTDERRRIIALAEMAVEHFNVGDWQALGVYTGQSDIINRHDRLLRSLSFGDDDYSGHVHGMIFRIISIDPSNMDIVEDYISKTYSSSIGENVSTAPSRSRSISFTPSVFEVPIGGVKADLVAVMTPFAPQFEPVFDAISKSASAAGYRTLRAKDIWEHSTVIQDVFSLIFKASIVVCDFTSKNPNVFYEAGIAHTLGKHVVPITQSANDIPFDLQHHRYLQYLNNREGLVGLENELTRRFRTIG